jgi:hypothetical protein
MNDSLTIFFSFSDLEVFVDSGFRLMKPEACYSHPYNNSKHRPCRHFPVERVLNRIMTVVEHPSTEIDVAGVL